MPLSSIRLDVAAKQKKEKKRERERERIRDEINYGQFCTVVILHFVGEVVTPPSLSLSLHLLRINHFACNGIIYVTVMLVVVVIAQRLRSIYENGRMDGMGSGLRPVTGFRTGDYFCSYC